MVVAVVYCTDARLREVARAEIQPRQKKQGEDFFFPLKGSV